MEILKIKNLKKIYDEGEVKIEVLNGIHLSIERGQMVAILVVSDEVIRWFSKNMLKEI